MSSFRAISGAFQQYDHGEVDNFMKYDQPKPPLYDLSKVNASVSIYYSNSDHYRPVNNGFVFLILTFI